jgi:hypothetical protein
LINKSIHYKQQEIDDLDYVLNRASDEFLSEYELAMKRKINELEGLLFEYKRSNDFLAESADRSIKKLAVAVESLNFYGNIENWRNPKYPQKHDFNVLDSEDGRDVDAIQGGHLIAGKRAREALKKITQ